MPGLVGFTHDENASVCEILRRMRALLRHEDNYVDDEVFRRDSLCASRTHLGILDQGHQPFDAGSGLFVWFEGELYNQDEIRRQYRVTAQTDGELLARVYAATGSFDFLANVDGCFAVVVFDSGRGWVRLITDRHGLKPLYWGWLNNQLVWASELKAFLAHPGFSPRIDPEAVAEFFDHGYLLQDRTWFEHVKLVSPATVLTYSIEDKRTEQDRYWSWDRIRPASGQVEVEEAARELGRAFVAAVHRQFSRNHRIGIGLSGGLDSRAICAAVPDDYKPFHAYTVGRKGCDDIRIARRVARIKGSEHHGLWLDAGNWFVGRVNAVWRSDAGFNLLHMHGSPYADFHRKHYDIILNGFLGDAILGGYYIDLAGDEGVADVVVNRGRRFINHALVLGETRVVVRRPFMDNRLLDLASSLPKDLRRNSYLYNKMLLASFPTYFERIPWQKTSYPIKPAHALDRLFRLPRKAVRCLKKVLRRMGVPVADLRQFADYGGWLRQDPGRSFCEKILLARDALYPEYVDRDRIHRRLTDHMEGKGDNAESICRALTFELWLQQVFDNRFRHGEEG